MPGHCSGCGGNGCGMEYAECPQRVLGLQESPQIFQKSEGCVHNEAQQQEEQMNEEQRE